MPRPATLVRQQIDALLAAAAAPASRRRPRPGAYTPLEERIAQWLRFVELDQGLWAGVQHPGDATRLRVMSRQLLVLEAAAELVERVGQGPAQVAVQAQGAERCGFEIDFPGCSLQGSLSPQVDARAYDLGFWPNDPVLEPDLVQRYLAPLRGLDQPQLVERLQARLQARYQA